MRDENKNEIEWVERKSWREFQLTGLIWWINTMLHTFGWAIAYDVNKDGEIENVYPARVKYRGFSQDLIEDGYKKVTKYMKDNAKELYEETKL